MKPVIVALGLLASAAALIPTEASAVVCARGIVRAGCADPNGAVVARRPVSSSRLTLSWSRRVASAPTSTAFAFAAKLKV